MPLSEHLQLLHDSLRIDAGNANEAAELDCEGQVHEEIDWVPNAGIGPPWTDIGANELVVSPVLLSRFSASGAPGRIELHWEGAFTGVVGDFRLTGACGLASWTVEYARRSDGGFFAEDRCERVAVAGPGRVESRKLTLPR